MATREPDPARSRRLKFAGLLLLVAAVLAVAGCGGSDTPAVCGSLDTLSADVDELQSKDLAAGEGAVAEIETSFDSIRTDLEAVKADAEAELSEPIAGLENSLDALSADVDAVGAAGDISAESAQALPDSVAAVSASWETLKTLPRTATCRRSTPNQGRAAPSGPLQAVQPSVSTRQVSSRAVEGERPAVADLDRSVGPIGPPGR